MSGETAYEYQELLAKSQCRNGQIEAGEIILSRMSLFLVPHR
jgi:hypothetical protein